MFNKWKFKIDLKNDVFNKIEWIVGKDFPTELKAFIIDNNAASPEKNRILVNGIERIVDSILSFNEKEVEAITFDSAYRTVNRLEWIPFAADPFGNYFCYSIINDTIGYFNHEEQFIDETTYSLNDFIEKLY